MKKIFKLFIPVLLLINLSGCNDLDTAPYDRISSETFWKTPEHAKQGIMGAYASLRAIDGFGKRYYFDNVGGLGLAWLESAYYNSMIGTATDRTSYIGNYWRFMYDGVQRANLVIRRVPDMTIDEAIKKPIVAEARFLRALHYAELLDVFGGVPLYDESIDLNADFNNLMNPRSTPEEVRAFILKDLTAAIADLPVKWPQAEHGRAAKGAAYALRGKIYLYAKDWKNAIADFEEVVYNKSNAYNYTLNPKYADLFKLAGHNSSEIIFAVQVLGGTGFSYGLPIALNVGFRGTFGGGGNYTMPANDLADLYENKDGSPFNWNDHIPGFNESTEVKRKAFWATHTSGKLTSVPDTALLGKIYRDRDPRLMATLVVPYSYYLGWVGNAEKNLQFVVAQGANENFGQVRNNVGWYTYLWRKFVPEGNEGGAIASRDHTPFNFPLIRFADVLLMLSEAYNEDGQLDKAVTELNKVRTRVNMPGLNSGAAWLKVSTKEEMFRRIVKERTVELALEGLRFSDLRRWGIAKEELNNKPATNLFGELQFTRVFTDRDYLWPIPRTEIEMNPALKQNPGWE